jgi:pyrimidine-nucleoside phosphorylase
MAGAQDVPALAAASLLAKKIACGVRFAGLDVRVAAHGNFGKTFHEASRAASMFCAAARMAGIEAVAVLTNARIPYQPFIGRGEALMALNSVFSRSADVWLGEHDDVCRLMATHVGLLDGKSRLGHGTGEIAQAFARNIEAQGSSMDAFLSRVDTVTAASRREVIAEHEGFLRLDLATIRSAFGKAHGRLVSEHEFPDAFGVILRKRPGAYARRGDVLASVRLDDALWPEISEFVSRGFQVAEAPDYAPGIEEVVRV